MVGEKVNFCPDQVLQQGIEVPGINVPFDAVKDGPPLVVLGLLLAGIVGLWPTKRRKQKNPRL